MRDTTRWTQKFFKCTDMVDEDGKPVTVKQINQDEFWNKGKTTADLMRKHNKPVKKYAN